MSTVCPVTTEIAGLRFLCEKSLRVADEQAGVEGGHGITSVATRSMLPAPIDCGDRRDEHDEA